MGASTCQRSARGVRLVEWRPYHARGELAHEGSTDALVLLDRRPLRENIAGGKQPVGNTCTKSLCHGAGHPGAGLRIGPKAGDHCTTPRSEERRVGKEC